MAKQRRIDAFKLWCWTARRSNYWILKEIMASPTWCTRFWVNSGSWWWTGRPGMLRFMGLQRVGHDWATELNWTERKLILNIHWKDWCWSWSSNTLASWCKDPNHWKRPWGWENLRAEEEGGKEDEMVGWRHWLNGHESEQTPVDGEGQGSLVDCSPWGRKASDIT